MPLRKLESRAGIPAFVVRGILTRHDVATIREALASTRSPAELVIDLREAPTPMAPALLDLAKAMGEANGRLRLLGLTAASERLLKLLGVELGSAVCIAPPPVEDVKT